MGALVPLLLVLSLLAAGCGGGSKNPTGSTVTAGRSVTAHLKDAFLFDHNAAFNDSRTFRWVPPIPIYIGSGDVGGDFLLAQFTAWEAALGGAGGTPFYEPRPATRQIPSQGIFFAVADLPDPVIGFGDPFVSAAQSTRAASLGRTLRQGLPQVAARRVEMPEVLASGEIRRCVIILDENLDTVSAGTLALIIRHEIGHCLGFLGHVSSGLMKPTCCGTEITSDVRGMMRKLYTLAPGTDVTR